MHKKKNAEFTITTHESKFKSNTASGIEPANPKNYWRRYQPPCKCGAEKNTVLFFKGKLR